MERTITLSKPDPVLEGIVTLEGSKSISNRALVMLHLCGANPGDWLSNLSPSRDTRLQSSLLKSNALLLNAEDAGTVFRFATAWLTLREGRQTLTGSARMLERPVGPLVDALRALGADIRYLGREGYPPLEIGDQPPRGGAVPIQSGISSQFLSALLMIGPYLSDGLLLIPEGPMVSRPYLDMTLKLMRYFGADAQWEGHNLRVAPGGYQPRKLVVEADWSGASYWYAMAALSEHTDLVLQGLSEDSLQGDAVLSRIFHRLGVDSRFDDCTVRLSKRQADLPGVLHQDFRECPDLAQALAVACAGLGQRARFTGLGTLRIKETDRIAALETELKKVGVTLTAVSDDQCTLQGRASGGGPPAFEPWGDHRMAMSLAALSMRFPVTIREPRVVAKSYPGFWDHLKTCGFLIG